VVDLAVGIIVGAAFTTIVNSLVNRRLRGVPAGQAAEPLPQATPRRNRPDLKIFNH
jgi:hypothetical protein